MSLINFETNLILRWSWTSVITNLRGVETFTITDTKHYVSFVTLSTQDNVKLLEKLKSGFKKTIKWNKYQSKESIDARNLNILDYLVDPSFQGVNRLFVLWFENNEDRATHTGYFFPVKIKYYNVLIDRRKFFWSTNKKWSKNIYHLKDCNWSRR